MAFRELAYQTRALDAMDAYLIALGEEKGKTDKVAAFIAENPDSGISLPDFPGKAWEQLKAAYPSTVPISPLPRARPGMASLCPMLR
jgi:hypothetical protein